MVRESSSKEGLAGSGSAWGLIGSAGAAQALNQEGDLVDLPLHPAPKNVKGRDEIITSPTLLLSSWILALTSLLL